jgi:hypothetical protein
MQLAGKPSIDFYIEIHYMLSSKKCIFSLNSAEI